jgi:predicted Zn-dependent protease
VKRHIRFIAPIALAVATLCATSASALFDGADEEVMGKESDKDIVRAYGIYDDPKVGKYVEEVGKRVLSKIMEPQFEYHFKTVDNEMVNAFALPGGYVYVTRGLLATLNSEAALAGVLGHEIGHVIGHHSVRQMKKALGSTLLMLGGLAASEDVRQNAGAWLTISSSMSQQILLGYGRDFEMESDQVGMLAAYDAGYDPNGIVSFLKSLRAMEMLGGQSYHGFSATHPDTVTRIIEAEGKSDLLTARNASLKDERDRYLDAIEGLRYGKPAWRGKTLPPYVIHVHTVKEGETLRSIVKDVTGDESLALETAVLNALDMETALKPGLRLKTLKPVKSQTEILLKKEEAENEISSGVGDGTGGQTGGKRGKPSNR